MTFAARVVLGVVVGAAAGLAIGWVDSGAGWNDTGVTAGTIVVVAGGVAYWQVRWPWLWAIVVGGCVLAVELARTGNAGSIAALAFTLGLIIIAAWAYRRYGAGLQLAPTKTSRLKVLEKRPLGATTTLYLVQHDIHEHLLSVTNGHTTLLHSTPTKKKPKK